MFPLSLCTSHLKNLLVTAVAVSVAGWELLENNDRKRDSCSNLTNKNNKQTKPTILHKLTNKITFQVLTILQASISQHKIDFCGHFNTAKQNKPSLYPESTSLNIT